jgi:serine/threonine protein kinase
MPLSPGDNLGPYEILALVGKGGMGEVYRAHDSRLNRDVAIKVSNTQFTERFTREARTIASLNHTNICHLYDVGPNYLVMEYVEGPDLGGPLDFDDALPIIQQIIDGIEAAHEKNIIHRDLKPANIKITPEGVVKILDFGLAKALAQEGSPPPSSDGNLENSPTLTMGATAAGTILGTAAYMAPEQAKGKAADKRSDIWSFGVVLYEVLTGKRLFSGESAVEILGGVLNQDPDISAAPPRVHKLLRWCLEKDRKQRLQSIGDARRLLSRDSDGMESVPTAPLPSRFGAGGWVAAGVLAVALAGVSFIAYRATRPAELKPLVRLDVDLGTDVSLPAPSSAANLSGSSVAISPDGMRLVYVSGTASGSTTKLFTRRLDQPKATELPGTEGAVAPFFSPDGQWVGFLTGGKLSKISVEGGAVVPLGEVGIIRGASWGEDGNIFMGVQGKDLVRIRDGGGSSVGSPMGSPMGSLETVAAPGNGAGNIYCFPQILPGGKAILFSAYTTPNPDASSIEVLTLADHHQKTVSRGGTSPYYVATSNGAGYLVYFNRATLFAIPFDLEKLETRGTAVPIVDDVASNGTYGNAQFSFSRNGTFVYQAGGADAGLLTIQWLDGAGKTQPLLAKPGNYGRPSLSPSGERVALEVYGGSGTDIWAYDWQRDTMTRLTFTGNANAPIWSPDGPYIAFGTQAAGMYVIRSDGSGKPQPLTQSKNLQYPWSFTPDGKRLAFLERDPKNSFDLWTVPLESDGAGLRAGKPEPFLQTPVDERYPVFSPDGRWLAYASAESGTFQIYVRAYPDKGGKWQISNTGGTYPTWSRSGHQLFFETLDQHIMAAAYRALGDSFEADKPRLWSEKPIGGGVNNLKNIDLAPDGKRIAALMPATEAKGAPETQNQVVFLENFIDELQRKVPVGK